MKYIFFISILFISLLMSCKDCEEIDIKGNPPECIKEVIKDIEESDFICAEGVIISEYKFQGESVYLIFPGDCIAVDMTTTVMNSNCETIGHLGGLTGNDEINGEKFYENSEFIQTIWED